MPKCTGDSSVQARVLPPRRRRRRRVAASCAAALIAATVPALASAAPTPNGSLKKGKGGRFGLGVSIGDPMGGSAKLFLHPNHALQFDIGWAPLHFGTGTLTATYLWHPGTFVSNSTLDFLPYLGFGTGIAFWASRCYGYYDGYYGRYRGRYCGRGGAAWMIRVPTLGLAIHWKGAPLDTVLEGGWSPFIVLPALAAGDIAFKIRYYF